MYHFYELLFVSKLFDILSYNTEGLNNGMVDSNRKIPEDPLAFIQQCIIDQKIYWTYHVNIRMKGRFISRKFILESIRCFEIIEEYPNDRYMPSYLVYSRYQGKVFHVLFATDVEEKHVRVITAYFPNLDEWDIDLKTRRRFQ